MAMHKASSLLINTRTRLEAVAAQLDCCQVKHVILPRSEAINWMRGVIVFLIAACLVFLVTVQDPLRRRGAPKAFANGRPFSVRRGAGDAGKKE